MNDIKGSFLSHFFLDLPHLPYDVHDVQTVGLAILVFFVKFVEFTAILDQKPQSFEAQPDDVGLVLGEAGQAEHFWHILIEVQIFESFNIALIEYAFLILQALLKLL